MRPPRNAVVAFMYEVDHAVVEIDVERQARILLDQSRQDWHQLLTTEADAGRYSHPPRRAGALRADGLRRKVQRFDGNPRTAQEGFPSVRFKVRVVRFMSRTPSAFPAPIVNLRLLIH